MLQLLASIVLVANGAYDIASATAVLLFTDSGLAQLHTGMFADPHLIPPLVLRMRAYWLYTYGVTRLVAGLAFTSGTLLLAVSTYAIEALCFEYEALFEHTMAQWKVDTVALLSTALALLVAVVLL